MIGLKRGSVELQPYTNEWEDLYEKEKVAILSLIKEYIIDLQHIGSTAVQGLKAKPIIDIIIGVNTFKDLPTIIEKLEDGGYIYRPQASTKERILFVKGTEERRTHHIHVVQWNDDEWNNNILFRDYLRKHSEVMREYAKLKTTLAEEFKEDRSSYTSGKNDFIKMVIMKAKKEE